MTLPTKKVQNAVFQTAVGAIGSGAFAWLIGVREAAQNVAKTTAPLFKDAVIYGALNGAIRFGVGEINEATSTPPEFLHPVVRRVRVLLCGLTCLAARYGIAALCNEEFATKITPSYIHTGTVARTPLLLCEVLTGLNCSDCLGFLYR